VRFFVCICVCVCVLKFISQCGKNIQGGCSGQGAEENILIVGGGGASKFAWIGSKQISAVHTFMQ
jgi:hypothetical protein